MAFGVPDMNPLPTRQQLEWVVPAVAVLATLAVTITAADALPVRLATSWSHDGQPSRHAPRESELILGVVVVVLGGAFVAVADRLDVIVGQRALIAFGNAAAAGWAAHRLRIIVANLHVEHWADAKPTVGLPVVAVCAAGAGLLGWFLSSHRRTPRDR
ncbi:MAG: hypothetical protein KG028_02030 [Actinobacteria bacterium]|nr:hypothetical protein [Actinomycetota bacterium]